MEYGRTTSLRVLIADSHHACYAKVAAAVSEAFAGSSVVRARTLEQAGEQLVDADLLLVHDCLPMGDPPGPAYALGGEDSPGHRLARKFISQQRELTGAIIYGAKYTDSRLWKESPPAYHVHFRDAVSPDRLAELVEVLLTRSAPPYRLEITVSLEPNDGAAVTHGSSPRMVVNAYVRTIGRSCDPIPTNVQVSPDDAARLRLQFREWARSDGQFDGLKGIGETVNDLIFRPKIWGLLNQNDCPPDRTTVAIVGAIDVLAYPLDLAYWGDGGCGFLANRYPVCWHVPERHGFQGPRDPYVPPVADPLDARSGAITALVVGSACGGRPDWETGDRALLPALRHVKDETKHVRAAIRGVGRLLCRPVSVSGPRSAKPNRRQFGAAAQRARRSCADLPIAFFHYSGHACLFDRTEEDPDSSGLVLAGGKPNSVTIFGIPDLRRALCGDGGSLRWGVNFAFLNCCEVASVADPVSARNSYHDSLVRELFCLPAHRIICHRWRVNDCLARDFAEAFYNGYLQAPYDLLHAFHRAQVAVGPEYTRDGSHRSCRRKCKPRSERRAEANRDKVTWLAPVLLLREYPQ